MGNIWVTSDTHFNHKNIIRYTKRPFKSVRQMNNTLIRRWNQRVKRGDIVYHLGDFVMAKHNIGSIRYFRRRLNGNIIIIEGNHDKKYLNELEKQGFKVIREEAQPLCVGKYLLSHRPLKKKDVPKGFINLYGHIHEKIGFNGINISVERTGFHPIRLDEVKNYQPNWFKRKLSLLKSKLKKRRKNE